MSSGLDRELERIKVLHEQRSALMKEGLTRDQLGSDPLVFFSSWFDHAKASGVEMPETMTLATVDSDGVPSIRNVSMRGRDETAFHFYTHYESTKGRALATNPSAAVLFNWLSLRRQVKLTGRVERGTAELSDAYFQAIPRPIRLRFIASQQSRSIHDRAEFEERLARVEAEYADRDVPRPENYGSFRLVPDVMEFWQQGYQNFLGDRFRYSRLAEGASNSGGASDESDSAARWKIDCLAP